MRPPLSQIHTIPNFDPQFLCRENQKGRSARAMTRLTPTSNFCRRGAKRGPTAFANPAEIMPILYLPTS